MSRLKRTIVILIIIIATMLILPLISVNAVKSDAGMMVTMILFFIVHPIVSVIIGILTGGDIKFFWFSPILVAGLFWAFSCFTYKTAFPVVYSVAYLVICAISMFIRRLIKKKSE